MCLHWSMTFEFVYKNFAVYQFGYNVIRLEIFCRGLFMFLCHIYMFLIVISISTIGDANVDR